MGRLFSRKAVALKVLGGCAAFAALLVLGVVAAKCLWWDAGQFAGYVPGAPLDASAARQDLPGKDFSVETIEINGINGERIPLKLALPHQGSPPYPCIIFLYGSGQNLKFFDKIAAQFAQAGTALAMPEQFHAGLRKQAKRNALSPLLDFRARCSQIVPETRRVVDYLAQRPDIDARRIDLMGASFGGISSCAVLANEPRLRAGVLVMAGGNLPRLFPHLAAHYAGQLGPARQPLALLSIWLFSAYDPVRFVGRIGGRPLLFQNLESDELIPRESTEALYDAAAPPKARKWYEASHNAIDFRVAERMIGDGISWARQLDEQPSR